MARRPPSNVRLTNSALSVLAVGCVLLTVLQAVYTVACRTLDKNGNLLAVCVVFAAAFLVIRLKASRRAKARVLFGLYALGMVELGLQGFSVFGVIPRVHNYEHIPYGRVYWRKEGYGHALMNRYGWHYPAFRLEAGQTRIAIIGDSFVQAVQVGRSENMGVRLAEMLRRDSRSGPREVMCLGLSAIGPAQYLEIMEYSLRHFDVHDFIIVICVGNDFRNSSVAVQSAGDASEYLYYRLDGDGQPVVCPESVRVQQVFRRKLDVNHAPLIAAIPRILKSHVLSPEVLSEIRKGAKERWRARERQQRASGTPADFAQELQLLGLDGFVFEKAASPAAVEATAIVHGLLLKCREITRRNGATLRLVTVPFFPQRFYLDPSEADWDTDFGRHDTALPERQLKAFCAENGIDFLPMCETMRADGLTPAEIRRFYFKNGSGHLTQQGHAYFAGALHKAFYGAQTR